MQALPFIGNWVDLVIIIFLFSLVISSLDKGFLINLIDLLGFVFSFFVSLKFYSYVAYVFVVYFFLPLGIANALGFILLGFLVETLFFLFIRIVYQSIPNSTTNSLLNKILGPIPALINGLVIIAFFLTVVVTTPVQPRIKNTILTSKLGGPIVARTQALEQDLAQIFGDAVLDTLSFITISPSSEEKVNLQFTTNNGKIDEEAENALLELVNQERRKIGLSALISSTEIQDAARHHAIDMLSKGYFSHINQEGLTPFERLQIAGIGFNAAGENLAFAPNVELAHQGLMQSPGHRANILSPDYSKVGIGVIDAGAYGRMFVEEFTD